MITKKIVREKRKTMNVIANNIVIAKPRNYEKNRFHQSIKYLINLNLLSFIKTILLFYQIPVAFKIGIRLLDTVPDKPRRND